MKKTQQSWRAGFRAGVTAAKKGTLRGSFAKKKKPAKRRRTSTTKRKTKRR